MNNSDNQSSAEVVDTAAETILAAIKAMEESAIGASTAIAELHKSATTALLDMQAKQAEVVAVATSAMAAKTQITDEQAVIATKSAHIQKAQEHADTVRAGLDRTLTASTQQATEAEGHKTRAQSAADAAAVLLTNVRTVKGSTDADAAAIESARKVAENSAATAKSLADKSAIIEERVSGYEARLADLEKQCQAQLKEITRLLPGATSAGLAQAFDARRLTFLKPHGRWQLLFVVSVFAIVVLAATGLWNTLQTGQTPSHEELVRLWLARLPIAGALVWLALHASRESALAKRLEEDYGYKSAVASSFLGFHKQLSEIGSTVASNPPLAKLCSDTLNTIATPPGRIYDQHQLTVSPTDEATHLVKGAVEATKHAAKPGG